MENTNWIPLIDYNRCTACGDCIAVCPTHVLDIVEGKVTVANSDACDYCGQCEAICPVNAINLPYEVVLETGS